MAQPNFNDALATITAFENQLGAKGIPAKTIENFKNFTAAFSNLTNFDATKIAKNLTAFATINSSAWNGLSTALSALTPILTRLGTTTVVEDGARALSTLSSALVGFTEIKFSKLTASIGKLLFFNTLISLPFVLGRVTNAFTKLGVMIAGLAAPAIAAGAEVLKDIGIGLTSLQNISFGKLIKSIFSVWALMPLLRGLFDRLKELVEILKDPASTDGAKNLDLIAKSLTTLGEVKWGKILIGTWAINRLKLGLQLMIPMLIRLGTKKAEITKGVIALMDVAEAVSKWGTFKIYFGLMAMFAAAPALLALAIAGAAFGLASPLITIASTALGVLAGAITAFGQAAKSGYFWLGILALAALVLIAMGLGAALLLAGVGAMLLGIGLASMIIPMLKLALMSGLILLMAASIIILAAALNIFALGLPAIVIAIVLLLALGVAMEFLGRGISKSLNPFIELSASADNLKKAAKAITSIGLAISKFRALTGASSIFSSVLSFFGLGDSDTLKLLKDLADLSSALDRTASALERILGASVEIDSMNLKNGAAQRIKEAANKAAEAKALEQKTKQDEADANKVPTPAVTNNSVINNSSNPSTVINNFGVNHGERTSGLFGGAMTGAA